MIEFIDVYKKYKSKKRIVTASKKINISFPNRGMIFILGPSGSGKTTIFNLISGIIKPTKGSILYNGQDITKFSGKKTTEYRNNEIGFIYQDNNLLESLSVGENIKIALNLNGKDLSKEDIEQKLSKYGLEDVYESFPSELSGGEAQRVAICRAILKQSRFMLADEPTGSLDQKSATTVMDSLKEISKERLVIVVSHDTILAEKYADRIIKISSGSIEEDNIIQKIVDGETKEYFSSEKTVSRIPFRFRLKLSRKFFCARPIKLALSSIVLVIAFMFLLIIINLLSFNTASAYETTVEKGNNHYGIVYGESFDNNDYLDIKNRLSSVCKAQKDNLNISILENDDAAEVEATDYYYAQVCTVISKENLNSFHFNLIGNLPKDNTEVVLPLFLSSRMNITKDNYKNINLQINKKNYSISGLLKTNTIDPLLDKLYLHALNMDQEATNDNGTYSQPFSYNYESYIENSVVFYDFSNDLDVDFCYTSTDAFEYCNSNNTNLSFKSPALDSVLQIKSNENSIVDFFYVGFFVSIILSVIGLINVVSSNIYDEEEEIKVLKILGAKNKFIFSIFSIQLFVFLLAISVLSVIFTLILSNYLNDFFTNNLGILFNIITFNNFRAIYSYVLINILGFICLGISIFSVRMKKKD